MMSVRRLILSLTMSSTLFAMSIFHAAAETIDGARRPIAITRSGSQWFVAHRDTGSISTVDLATGRVVAEQRVCRSIADFAVLANSDLSVALDSEAHRVMLLERTGTQFRVLDQATTPLSPVRITTTASGDRIAVALQWARQVDVYRIHKGIAPAGQIGLSREARLDLDFAPLELLFVEDDTTLIAADAFGPQLAVIDVSHPAVRRTVRIPGHNIRGLAVDATSQRLWIAHQLLNEFLPGSRDHVFWGNVLANVLRSLPLDQLLEPNSAPHGSPPERIDGTILPLGGERHGAGDPGRILVLSDGALVVALSGVHELAISTARDRSFVRVPVGRGPRALAVGSEPGTIVTANLFDDSISIVDVPSASVVREIALRESKALTAEQRGEMQFHNAALSLDRWFSCHSCHADGHTSGGTSDNLGDDSYGEPKRVVSLLGVGDTSPWAWNGSQSNLTDQVRKSMFATMHGAVRRKVAEEDVFAIADFLQSLSPPPGIDVARGQVDTLAVERGLAVFRRSGCIECHVPPEYTLPDVRPTGLADAERSGELNPPSLRGVSQQIRWLHDGRATTLRDVLTVFNHHGNANLSRREIDDLQSFLRSL